MTTPYADVHSSPQGSGDARPTALQIVKDTGVAGKWTDRTIFITGVSSGLGVETAKALVETGATLYLTARNLEKVKAALGEPASSDKVHLLELELDSLDSVRKAASTFLSQSKRLDVLIGNAGIMACPFGKTHDGFETQIGTNHLGHFLLFALLKDRLLKSPSPRFIALSSMAHRFGAPQLDDLNWTKRQSDYKTWEAYGTSKTAAIWLANEAQRRYASQGLTALSLHPGAIMTGLQQYVDDDMAKTFAENDYLKKVFKSVEQGAVTTVWAATSDIFDDKDKGGLYLEDCGVARAWTNEDGQWGPGYADYTYSPEKEAEFWKISCNLVGAKL